MAESFGVEDRGHFYDPVGALRDVVVNHMMQVVAASAMEVPASGRGRRAQGRAGVRLPRDAGGRPAHYVRGQYEGYRSIRRRRAPTPVPRHTRRCGWRSITGAGSGVPFFLRTGKCLPITQTEFGSCSGVRLGSGSRTGRERPSPARWSSSSTHTGISFLVDAQRHEAIEPEQITLDMEFAQEGGEGPTPYEVLAACRADRRQQALHPPGRRRGVLAGDGAAARAPTAGAPVREGFLGSRGRRQVLEPASDAGTTVGGVMITRQEQALARERCRGRRPTAPAKTDGKPQGGAERRGAVAVHSDRQVRVPVGLPYGRAGRARRDHRLAVRPSV